MIMTKNDLKDLLSRNVYQRLLNAYDYRMTVDQVINNDLADIILEAIKNKFPEFYNDYDRSSILVNDFLQKVIADVFRNNIKGYRGIFTNGKMLYQSRIIHNCIKEICKKKNINIGEEIAASFTWFCYYEKSAWFINFLPIEIHQGGYFWDDDIRDMWKEFCNKFSK